MSDFPNWFEITARANFERFLLPLAEQDLRCLQLGVFTGDATVWMMENLPRALLVDVDPWTGAETIEHFDYDAARATYLRRTVGYLDRRSAVAMTSAEYFARRPGTQFDFVYVDGDHRAPIVLADAVSSFSRLRAGGMIAFDDYTWDSGHGLLHNPAIAIDAFLAVYAEHLELLEQGSQVWVRRL